MFSGREGGTWLAVGSNGKIGCLLNILQSVKEREIGKLAEGRGFLALDYVKNDISAEEYAKKIIDSKVIYNDFNLILLEPNKSGDFSSLYYNFGNEPVKLSPGVNGFGNCSVDNQFRKVLNGIDEFKSIVEDKEHNYLSENNKQSLEERLIEMMQNKTYFYPDENIIRQGKGYAESFHKGISSMWIEMRDYNYGTR